MLNPLFYASERRICGDLTLWSLHKHVPGPSINFVDLLLLHKLVASDPWHNLCPNKPVDTTGEDDTEANDAVNPVRQIVVDVLALVRWAEGSNHEVDVAEEEEDDDRECCIDWGVPVAALPVEVKVDHTCSNESVDNSERVRDQAIRVVS